MKSRKNRALASMASGVVLCLFAQAAGAAVCTDGLGEPPFLSYGVKPNLLLMIDNSASMYDLAYDDLDEPGFCNDDSYIFPSIVQVWASGTVYPPNSVVSVSCSDDVGTAEYWFRTAAGGTSSGTLCADRETCGANYCYIQTDAGVSDWAKAPRYYAGYFESSAWYRWSSALGKFETIATPASPGDACTAASGTEYTNSDTCIIISNAVSPKTVEAFAASGNFLNWASASKFDIEKGLLTGGKYTGTTAGGNVTLVGESRGCLNRRMVRQVAVSSGVTTYYLSLAVQAKNAGSDFTSKVEIFEVTEDGFQFNGTACEAAIAAAAFGQVQNLAGDCLMIGKQNESFENSNSAFNHGFQTCWGYPTVGVGDISRMENACQNVYNAGVNPGDIETEDSGYVCMGDPSTGDGYVGRCVNIITPGTPAIPGNCTQTTCTVATVPVNGSTQYCDGSLMWQCPAGYAYNSGVGKCKHGNDTIAWDPKETCVGGTPAVLPVWSWVSDALEDLDDNNLAAEDPGDGCIERAIRDYCAAYYDPGVPDPIGPVETLAEEQFPNLPAILTGVALNAQLGEPLATYDAYIHKGSDLPQGLLHQKKADNDLRIGLMTFNSPDAADPAEGTLAECSMADPHRLYNCTGATNRDGGKVLANVDEGASHFDTIIDSINDIKAKTWTPYAEAFYDALGYYTQDSSLRLDVGDFTISAAADPITNWCQDNHILILTDGSSTADRNATMTGFVTTLINGAEGTADDIGDCGDFDGSSYLDDLTYYAQHGDATDLYPVPQLEGENKQNIKTHIVTTGTLRVTGTDECSPNVLLDEAATNGGTTLYAGEDASALRANLLQVFEELKSRSSSGSAASVISSSRGGEGAVYQAVFWPSLAPASGTGDPVRWVGDVHAMFVDTVGNLYEDTNGNRELNINEDTNGDGQVNSSDSNDSRVIIYFDEDAKVSKACYVELTNGGCFDTATPPNPIGQPLSDVKYLWSANDWLASLSDATLNRGTYLSNTMQRYIITWNDKNNNGIVDINFDSDADGTPDSSDEVLPFEAASIDWYNLVTPSASPGVGYERSRATTDFNVATDADADKIVNWVRGQDQVGLRPRSITYDLNHDGNPSETITWRLGDVIHSTPMVVGRPAEGFHFLYGDTSYSDFFAKYYNRRRNMIYFGGNDGMLHAVNGGFYNENEKKFCLTENIDIDGNCCETIGFDEAAKTCDASAASANAPALGAEMWAYVPYNVTPHLKCLTNPDYQHKYYVDQRPRIFDVRAFPADSKHPGGWGTILVGAMRFGGATETATALTGADASDSRIFKSSYFILDITDPEEPPTVLGEITMTDSGTEAELGYTTAIPTMVVMKNGTSVSDYKWYLILGSGPTNMKGESSQKPKVAVIPMDWLTSATKTALRIPNATPVSGSEGGVFTMNGSANGFVSDIITVDYDLDQNYMSDAFYFGTVEGSFASGFGGKMYRIVTRKLSGDNPVVSLPSEWDGITPKGASLNYAPLIDAERPIVSAASVGTDGHNFWIYFGTGRFYDADDKTDSSQQVYFGIKEPMDCNGNFSWETVEKIATVPAIDPGDRGLWQVDQILVQSSTGITSPNALSCKDGTTDCLPSVSGTPIETYKGLVNYIAGTGCSAGSPTGIDGWYKYFSMDRERNLGQATLLGGLLTFTSYQPYADLCRAEGLARLFGVYYQTGTPWYKPIFTPDGTDADNNVLDSILLGRGLATTPNLHVGADDQGAKAFVQTSTGAIVEVPEINTPLPFKGGRASWIELTE